MNHRIRALFFDLGDTLMIEESEIKDADFCLFSLERAPS
jgi:hypothetical protein